MYTTKMTSRRHGGVLRLDALPLPLPGMRRSTTNAGKRGGHTAPVPCPCPCLAGALQRYLSVNGKRWWNGSPDCPISCARSRADQKLVPSFCVSGTLRRSSGQDRDHVPRLRS